MNFDPLRSRILPLRQALLTHPIYQDLQEPRALRIFMQYHVFAVWDFMSLLKALQQGLTCVTVPWVPSSFPAGSRFINEIVLGEESDEDGLGGYGSHYELYHRAMTQFGADTSKIDATLLSLRSGLTVSAAMQMAEVPESIQRFVGHTFAEIEGGNICRIASAFTFGREDLLPGVFQRIVDELNQSGSGALEMFRFYLQRHIELDGGEHGPMAAKLIGALCGDTESNWKAASDAAVAALSARLEFWDAIHAAIS
ncbi:MAG: hypothetical protein JWM11_225 [Planctomycetaceae bacterium]|nr:hypothetical protein [Planctomycetaceae bacterium]